MESVVTADLRGGLGNQLFMIACAYAISKKLEIKCKFLRNQFGGCGQGSHPSKYYHNLFDKLEFVQTLPPINAIVYERVKSYYPIEKDVAAAATGGAGVIMIQGYFQCEDFFKMYEKEIRALFQPSIGVRSYIRMYTSIHEKFPELLTIHDYAFLGVRRGDYLAKADYHNPCDMNYYLKAMNRMGASRYYIGSDDIAWCRAQFVGTQFVFMDIEDDLEQFYAMMLFPKYIISNSSYYWWGSYLSVYDSPVVIAPSRWSIEGDAIYRRDMIVLDRP